MGPETTSGASPDAPPAETEVVRLAKLVKLMRETQKRFFAGDRSPAVVGQARDLEKRVDRAVAWVLAHRQGELFPRNSGEGPYSKEGG